MSENPRWGRYTILRRIGTGGMAEIFKCRLQGLGGFDKTMVIKRILPDLLDDTEFVRMFLDEARISANLNHPNIVQIYEIDQIDNVPYIAMEYVRGPTLARLLREGQKQGRREPAVIVKIMSEVCNALHYAHNALDAEGQPLGIIHRDVSPHNIIISTDGVPKLLDFGVAKARGRLSKTNAGTVKGKLRYMSPEQFLGKKAQIDHRVDVFSAGVCLYQAVTGQLPYTGESEVEVMKAAAAGEYIHPSDLVPDVDPELERLILWAMAPDPNDRCPTALELSEALAEYVSSGLHRVTTYHVKRHIKALFGDLDNSDVLGIGAYSGEPVSSRRFASSGRTSLSDERPGSALEAVVGSMGSGAHAQSGVSAVSGSMIVGPGSGPTPLPAQGMEPSSPSPGPGEPALSPLPSVSIQLSTVSEWLSPRRLLPMAAVGLCITALGITAFIGRGRDEAPVPAQTAQALAAATRLQETADAATYVDEAEKLVKDGRYQAALELLEKAQAGRDLGPALEIRAAKLKDRAEREALLAEARAALQAGQLPLAKEKAKAALLLDADHPEAAKLLTQAVEKERAQAPKQPAPREPGTLTVVTDPPARVFIDDQALGVTPLRRRSLPAGTHTVEVQLRGYVPQRRVLTITPRQESKLQLNLVRTPSSPPARRNVAAAVTPEQTPVMVASRQPEPVASDAVAAAIASAPPLPVGERPSPAPAPAEKEGGSLPAATALTATSAEPRSPEPAPAAPTGGAVASVRAAAGGLEDEEGPIPSCPEGAALSGAAPPRGTSLWCELPGKVRHGKFVRWYANGRIAETGEFRQGKKNGRWVEFYENGGERERTEWRRGVKSW